MALVCWEKPGSGTSGKESLGLLTPPAWAPSPYQQDLALPSSLVGEWTLSPPDPKTHTLFSLPPLLCSTPCCRSEAKLMDPVATSVGAANWVSGSLSPGRNICQFSGWLPLLGFTVAQGTTSL